MCARENYLRKERENCQRQRENCQRERQRESILMSVYDMDFLCYVIGGTCILLSILCSGSMLFSG